MDALKKWLEDNPAGMMLGAACGLLLLALVVIRVLASFPLAPDAEMVEAGDADSVLDLPQLAENQPIDSYNVIIQRPLFNPSRQPAPEEDSAGFEEALPEEPAERPDVQLLGVIITPTLRMVTLKRMDNAESLVAFEGQPIEADFGNWLVSRVEARTATLSSGSGEELQLEMKVHDEKIEEPEKPVSEQKPEPGEAGEAEKVAAADTEPLSRAEEIRQRIAERREELRREAEEQGGNNVEQAPPSYQDAIQSMISRNRRERTQNENE